MLHLLAGSDFGDAGGTEGDETAGEETIEDGEGDHGGVGPHEDPAEGQGSGENCHHAEDVEPVENS